MTDFKLKNNAEELTRLQKDKCSVNKFLQLTELNDFRRVDLERPLGAQVRLLLTGEEV